MATERRRQMILGVLLVVLAFVLYRAVTYQPAAGIQGTSSGNRPSSNGRARTATSGRLTEPPATAPDVHLRALDDERPKPISGDRNLFRFKPKPPPPPPPGPAVTRPAETAQAPTGPPPPPPIALKFIGIVDAGPTKKVVAILSDGRGSPVYGREGETVLGQYRILRIGTESIEMSYLDGRGRQTIRFTGS
jgi:hypothetical protein